MKVSDSEWHKQLSRKIDEKNADAPSTHKTQYFEMIGDHAIYHDGWILSSKVMRVPWDNSGTADKRPETWPWELYDLSKDWTQYDDVAAQYPEKVKELEKLFWEEAERNQVLPMDTTTFTRSLLPRPNLTADRITGGSRKTDRGSSELPDAADDPTEASVPSGTDGFHRIYRPAGAVRRGRAEYPDQCQP